MKKMTYYYYKIIENLMAQESVITTVYMTRRTRDKLDELCKIHGENRSRVISQLIADEYQQLKSDENDEKRK